MQLWNEDRVLVELRSLYSQMRNGGVLVAEPVTAMLDVLATLPVEERDSLMTFARAHGHQGCPLDERTARTMAAAIANALNDIAHERAA